MILIYEIRCSMLSGIVKWVINGSFIKDVFEDILNLKKFCNFDFKCYEFEDEV